MPKYYLDAIRNQKKQSNLITRSIKGLIGLVNPFEKKMTYNNAIDSSFLALDLEFYDDIRFVTKWRLKRGWNLVKSLGTLLIVGALLTGVGTGIYFVFTTPVFIAALITVKATMVHFINSILASAFAFIQTIPGIVKLCVAVYLLTTVALYQHVYRKYAHFNMNFVMMVALIPILIPLKLVISVYTAIKEKSIKLAINNLFNRKIFKFESTQSVCDSRLRSIYPSKNKSSSGRSNHESTVSKSTSTYQLYQRDIHLKKAGAHLDDLSDDGDFGFAASEEGSFPGPFR